MQVTITNLTSRPVWISLNSNSSLRLSPGGKVEKIAEVEVRDNAQVRKLWERRQIALTDEEGARLTVSGSGTPEAVVTRREKAAEKGDEEGARGRSQRHTTTTKSN